MSETNGTTTTGVPNPTSGDAEKDDDGPLPMFVPSAGDGVSLKTGVQETKTICVPFVRYIFESKARRRLAFCRILCHLRWHLDQYKSYDVGRGHAID
jgi:hypothetical protein